MTGRVGGTEIPSITRHAKSLRMFKVCSTYCFVESTGCKFQKLFKVFFSIAGLYVKHNVLNGTGQVNPKEGINM